VIPRVGSAPTIGDEGALRLTAVYGAVRILSESVAQLPLILYERQQAGGKSRAVGGRLYRLLHDAPNEEMTSFELREMMMVSLCLRGNAYCEVVWDRRGQVESLWWLHPDMVQVRRGENGRLLYDVRPPLGKLVTLTRGQIWHVRGMSLDGVTGLSPISVHAQGALRLARAADSYGAAFFENGARPSGLLEYPGVLDDDAFRRLDQSWSARHGSGLNNAQRIAILEEGMTYKPISLSNNEAQFLETRRYQVADIARIFRVPLHKLAELSSATFSNIEHQSLEFVRDALDPWLRRFEQSISRDLMVGAERERYFAEFLVEGLLRGDISGRYEAYAKGRMHGWLSADDVRERENENPLPDGQGKIYLSPVNMVPATMLTQPGALVEPEIEPVRSDRRIEARGERRSAEGRLALQMAYAGLFAEAMQRTLRRERQDVMAQARKVLRSRSAQGLAEWLDGFFSEHEGFVARALRPVVLALLPLVIRGAMDEVSADGDAPDLLAFADAYIEAMAARQAGRSRRRIDALLAGAGDVDALAALEEGMAGWEDRAVWLGQDEAVRAVSALAVAALGRLGVIAKRWVTMGESCPYCESLSGKVVGIDEPFLAAGETLHGGSERPALVLDSAVGHPPSHSGCDCVIMAA
jgi:HK97 family phage portal protein